MRHRITRLGVSSLPMLTLVALLALTLGACREETDVADERQAVPDASPTALAELPEGIEAVDIAVRDGQFSTGEIIVREQQPTVLRLDNQDDQDYVIRINDLVTETGIPAGEVTQVNFTTPNAGRYTAELLAVDDDEVVATVSVLVQAPGRTAP